MVKVLGRKDATLYFILTNMHENYSAPKTYQPFGLSDHNPIVAFPKVEDKKFNQHKLITSRDRRTSRKNKKSRYLSSMNCMVSDVPFLR